MANINPYESLPERLHNCPNCGGTLQDDGKCRFCGSVVYDFLGIDLDKHTPTYIRMKYNGKIVHFKAIFDCIGLSLTREYSSLYADNRTVHTMKSREEFNGTVEFRIDGDIIVEDPKITGVGG